MRENLMLFRWISALHFIPAAALALLVYRQNIQWLWSRWMENPDYSHGPLIPLISLYILYRKKEELAKSKGVGSNSGLLVLAGAVFIFFVGIRVHVNFLISYSLIIFLLGAALFLFGWSVTRILAFPVLFLFFMIPFWGGAFTAFGNFLKLISSTLTTETLRLLGYAVFRDGVTLHLSNGALEVADPCSGIRSLMALTALGTVTAYLARTGFARKIVIVLLGVPLAVIFNTLRVIFFAVMLEETGVVIGEGPLHTFSGLAVFGLAVFTLLMASRWMQRI